MNKGKMLYEGKAKRVYDTKTMQLHSMDLKKDR